MSSHLTAVMALTPAAITAYDTDVTESPSYPYALFTAPEFMSRSDVMSDDLADVSDYFQVTAVGETVEQARWCQAQMRAALDDAAPTVTGFSARVKHSTAGIFTVDRDVTLDDNSHPAYAVDTYRYDATPA